MFVTYAMRVTGRAISLGARMILAGLLSTALIWRLINRLELHWESLLWAALLAIIYVTLLFLFRVGSPGDIRSMVTNLRQSNG